MADGVPPTNRVVFGVVMLSPPVPTEVKVNPSGPRVRITLELPISGASPQSKSQSFETAELIDREHFSPCAITAAEAADTLVEPPVIVQVVGVIVTVVLLPVVKLCGTVKKLVFPKDVGVGSVTATDDEPV